MSDTLDHSGMSEDELLAAELVLGVLAGTDRATALRLLERDRNFASMVAHWEGRLSPWAAEIEEVAPSPQVWERVAAALLAPSPQSAAVWESLAFWRIFALASTLAAACLAVLVYVGTLAPQAPLVATIEGGGRSHFVATTDAKRGTVAVVPAAYSADATREPELWLIPADGKPRPLGMLRADRRVSIAIPANLTALAVSNAVLAVSLEPPGGSTTGAPTGPVIATGKLTNP
jgi:anti-sigma-K factor RskA